MPRRKKENIERKQRRRDQILQAALELFASQGYHATSVDQIAQRAGISKGLVYNYFESKQHLLKTLVQDVFDHIDNLFIAKPPEDYTDEDLIRIVKVMVQMLKDDLRVYRLYFVLYLQPDVDRIIKDYSRQYIEKLIKYLTPFFQRKGVKNIRVHVLGLLTALDGLALHYLLYQYPEVDEILEEIIEKYIKL